jgi:hypothetical protein
MITTDTGRHCSSRAGEYGIDDFFGLIEGDQCHGFLLDCGMLP